MIVSRVIEEHNQQRQVIHYVLVGFMPESSPMYGISFQNCFSGQVYNHLPDWSLKSASVNLKLVGNK